jgi:hypothetical protein
MYEGWIERGPWGAVRDLWRNLRVLTRRARCAECGKKLNRRQGDPYVTHFCSKDCKDGWLPF